MKAYIFKSARARRMMEEWLIDKDWIKKLQGSCYPVVSVNPDDVIIQDTPTTTWAIPLEACNLIEEEEEGEVVVESATLTSNKYLYFYDSSAPIALRRYKVGEQIGEICLQKPAIDWTPSEITLDTAQSLTRDDHGNHYQQITEKEAKRLFPDSF